MWGLPGPGIDPMSPALVGRFLTTGPSGKSNRNILNVFWGLPCWSSGKYLASKCRRCGVQSLVIQLRSHMPHGQKIKHKTEEILSQIQLTLLKWSISKKKNKRALNDGFQKGFGGRAFLIKNEMNRMKHVWEMENSLPVLVLTMKTICQHWKVMFSPGCWKPWMPGPFHI